ncbi:MAG: RHS repeat-associated core domain-containing protein, partial [Planctomycetes bacterium]|nr:RHS repeat-associated core domain-containing protein [Planctomycetota bacterium]
GGTGAGALDTSNAFNPDGQVSLSYEFDGNSRLTGIVDDNGNRTRNRYDALNRRVTHIYAIDQADTGGRRERFDYVYDRDSNVLQVTDPNGTVVTKSFDVLNRTTATSIARAAGVGGTTAETLEYDGLSRLTRCTDDNGGPTTIQTAEKVYDSLSRLIEERQNGQAVSNVFTGDSKRLQCTYPGGRVIRNTFDVIDRVKTINDATGTVTQIAATDWIGPGLRELRRQNANGTKLTFLNDAENADLGYDAVQRITRLRVLAPGGASSIVDREYAYNRASVRTSEQRHDDFGLTDSYSYDSLYRVVSTAFDTNGLAGAVSRPTQQLGYTLDGVGNRREVAKTSASGTTTEDYAVNQVNQYTSKDGVARSHSRNGNLLSDGTRSYVYDYKNRLTKVARVSDGAPVADYLYHCDNRRSVKVVYSATQPGVVEKETRFFYDGWRVCEDQSGVGASELTYVYSPVYVDEPVQLRREAAHPLGPGVLYTHQNARADVVSVTDGSGAVVEQRFFDDFGKTYDETKALAGASAVGNPYGFQGRRFDAETGLLYFRNRFYDPEVGRFLQRDPVWDAGNVGGQYSFVGSGPASGVDPMGLQQQPGFEKEGGFWSRVGGSVQAIGNALGAGLGLTKYDSALQEQYNPLNRAERQGGAVEAGTKGSLGVAVGAVGVAGFAMAGGGATAAVAETFPALAARASVLAGSPTGLFAQKALGTGLTVLAGLNGTADAMRGDWGGVGQNLVYAGLGAGSLRGPKKLPCNDGLKSEIGGGKPIPPEQFAKMKAAFEKNGGTISQNADAQRYLKMRNAEGITFNKDTMLLPPNPTTSAVYEEFIHVGQFRRGMVNSSSIIQNEIDAAQRLIKNAGPWGIPASETAQTQARLTGLMEAAAKAGGR